MSPRPTRAQVEERIRTALLARSADVVSPATTDVGTLVDARPDRAPLPPPDAASRRRRVRAALAVGTVAAALSALVLVAQDQAPSRRQSVAAGTDRGAETEGARPLTCGPTLPLLVGVPGAPASRPGPSPGSPPPADGQLVVHWPRTGGAVEVRWPAPAPPSFAPRLSDPRLVAATVSTSPSRTEIDVRTQEDAVAVDPVALDPDVLLDRPTSGDTAEPPAAPCDVVQLTVETDGGRWVTGVRVASPSRGSAFETVDLEARVVERRAVAQAPTTAVRCEGGGDGRRPANRSGGAAPHVRGAEPIDVLAQYLASAPGAVQRGYVEMAAPDGSVTFGVDPGGRGWTTLVFVARDGDAWSLAGWTASGC